MKAIIYLFFLVLPFTSFAEKVTKEKRLKPEFSAQVETPDSVAVDLPESSAETVKEDEYTPVDFSKAEEKAVVDRNEIKNILRANLPHFSSCYQKELNREKQPNKISGVINFKILIKSDGSVKRTEIYFTGKKTPKMNDCMFAVINKIRFPVFKNATGLLEINQTIKLHPKKI